MPILDEDDKIHVTIFDKETGGGQVTAIDKQELVPLNGFADYNDTTGPITISPDTWTDLPNNGLGAFTNEEYLPGGVTSLLDFSTGKIDPTELEKGDMVFIRKDFTVVPSINNANLFFRYTLGDGGGAYVLPGLLPRLDEGAGEPTQVAQSADFVYMGDDNTQSNLIGIQVKCSVQATLTNAGFVVAVIKRRAVSND